MHARVAPAREGWLWIRQGWQLFRRQPFALALVAATYVIASLVALQVVNFFVRGFGGIPGKAIGYLVAVLFAVAVPGITAGLLEACRRAREKTPVQVSVLFEPFRQPKPRRSLLMLGLVQVMALVVVVAVSPDFTPASAPGSVPDHGSVSGPASAPVPQSAPGTVDGGTVGSAEPHAETPAPRATTPAQPSGTRGSVRSASPRSHPAPAGSARVPPTTQQILAERKSLMLAGLFQMILYLPITIALWYAPMLVYWHGISPGKAMFFSAAAIWRNLGAFSIYGLALALCLSIAAYAIAALLALLNIVMGMGKYSLAVLAPFILVLFAWFYCTIYASYTAVFVGPPEGEPGDEPGSKSGDDPTAGDNAV